MTRHLILVLATAAALAAAPALAAEQAALVAAKQELQAGINHGKAGEIQHARAGFAALLSNEPDSPELNYWVALAGWRALPVMPDTDKVARKRLCKESLAACDRAWPPARASPMRSRSRPLCRACRWSSPPWLP